MNLETERVREKLQSAFDATLAKLHDLGGQLQSLAQEGAQRFRFPHRQERRESPIRGALCCDPRKSLDDAGRYISENRTTVLIATALVAGVIIGGILLDRRRRLH